MRYFLIIVLIGAGSFACTQNVEKSNPSEHVDFRVSADSATVIHPNVQEQLPDTKFTLEQSIAFHKKFLQLLMADRSNHAVEFPGIYDKLAKGIADDSEERIMTTEILRKKGFRITGWGRGNYPPRGPRFVFNKMQKDSCECEVLKIYYSTNEENLFEQADRVSCKTVKDVIYENYEDVLRTLLEGQKVVILFTHYAGGSSHLEELLTFDSEIRSIIREKKYLLLILNVYYSRTNNQAHWKRLTNKTKLPVCGIFDSAGKQHSFLCKDTPNAKEEIIRMLNASE